MTVTVSPSHSALYQNDEVKQSSLHLYFSANNMFNQLTLFQSQTLTEKSVRLGFIGYIHYNERV